MLLTNIFSFHGRIITEKLTVLHRHVFAFAAPATSPEAKAQALTTKTAKEYL